MVHFIANSEAKIAACGRLNPNSAVIGDWWGVTCKLCLKHNEFHLRAISSPPAKEAGELRELIANVEFNHLETPCIGFNKFKIGGILADSILALLTPYIDQLAKERGYVKLAKEQELPIIKNDPLLKIPLAEGYEAVVTTVEQQNEIDKLLLTNAEWEACEGDNEDELIAQHNKTASGLFKAGWRKVE